MQLWHIAVSVGATVVTPTRILIYMRHMTVLRVRATKRYEWLASVLDAFNFGACAVEPIAGIVVACGWSVKRWCCLIWQLIGTYTHV